MCWHQPALASRPSFISWRVTVASELTFLRQTRGRRVRQVFLSLWLVSRQSFRAVPLSCSLWQRAQHRRDRGTARGSRALPRLWPRTGTRTERPRQTSGTGRGPGTRRRSEASWRPAGGRCPGASPRSPGPLGRRRAGGRAGPPPAPSTCAGPRGGGGAGGVRARSRRWCCCLKSPKANCDANDPR